ncbi:MAG: aldehyde-activating protein [Bacteroidota bacterium]
MPRTYTYEGQCHCGAIRARLQFTKPAEEIEVRACQCGFCTRHGSMTISDPAGKTILEVRKGQLHAYQFASRTATSLLCQSCGVYAGAILQDGDDRWSVVSVRGLPIPEFLGRTPTPMIYDAETPDQRIARRKAKWTPTELRLID